jgi:branched-chain amino acid transport system permease protein
MLGAAIVVSLRTYVGTYTDYWTLILGLLMMFLILFMPKGVLGFFHHLLRAKSKNVQPQEASIAEDHITSEII